MLHFTPTSGSWLNLVERWFGELTNKKLKRSAHRNVQALNKDIRQWIETWNENPRPYVWTKTSDQILESISHLLPTNQPLRTLGHPRAMCYSVRRTKRPPGEHGPRDGHGRRRDSPWLRRSTS